MRTWIAIAMEELAVNYDSEVGGVDAGAA